MTPTSAWTMLAAALATLVAGCQPCMGGGANSVAVPDYFEFQLVFNNIVARNVDLYVDDEYVGTACEETEYITVGNFPVSTATRLKVFSPLSDSDCHISPCCSSDCDSQSCSGAPVIDTTPFAGGVYNTGLIWRF